MQPAFFLLDDDQHVAIIASVEDGMYINMQKNHQEDLDQLYQISSIREIIYDHEENVFYILSNKYQRELGFFIIMVAEYDPNDFKFIMKVKNQLDIADASMSVLRDDHSRIKELVVAYKTIYVNTYNINVIDISSIQ